MTEFFAQPDDTGELQASDLNTSLGERLGAQAGEAAFGGLRTLLRNKEYSEAESGQEGLESQIGRLSQGEDLGDVVANPQPSKLIAATDAQERVKQAGVSGIKLPAGDIREPVLDLMIKHAHEREQYDAALSRGPSGLLPGALGFVTEVGAGMIDPVNVAAFSIPVMGEARFGMMLARAGDSIANRAVVRAGVGAAQGAVGSTLLEPAQWWLHTRDGQDYTYADALRGVIMGAAMGGAFGAVHGAASDVRARAGGRPLAGSTEDMAARALAGDEHAASILQATPEGRRALAGEQPAPSAEAAPAPAVAPPVTEEAPPGLAPAPEPRAPAIVPEPEAVFTDLPAQVREDTVRASMADAINGNLGRGGELLKEAAKEDPRIAESIAAGRESTMVNAAEFSEPARAVFTDMSAQLKAAGMSDDEAAANAAVVAARYEARAARLEGAGGTAEDLYRAEGIRVQRGGMEDELGRSYAQRRRPLPGQSDLFGGARATDAEMAQRGANEPLRPGVAQKPMDEGLFGDTANQSDLVDAAKGRQLFQPPTVPTFYSAVTRALDSARQEKASPDQWLATLRNTPGVKQEELQWLGLPDWLKEQKGSVTRQQVQDYVRANNIEVQEVHKATDAFQKTLTGHKTVNETKFASYTLPGGENYRELLLTLPSDARKEGPPIQGGNDLDNFALRPGQPTVNRRPDYVSSHWDEPNILSHIRFNDRTIDGKKTLFIEEIQSDWHQAGKRKGYRQEMPATERASIESDLGGLHDQQMKMIEAGQDYSDRAARRWNPDYLAIMDKISALKERLDTGSGVPDAPFKTTWPELAFKRMIRYAAENGYEKIAWTPGEVQAERYDLSKHIKEIEYVKNSDGTYKLGIADKEGEPVGALPGMDVNKMTLPQVEEALGKEVAEKIKNEDGRRFRGHDGITLENVDLKVGGEGMKGFYDKILPATVNKLVKKYGAKVEDANLPETGGIGQWRYEGPAITPDVLRRAETESPRGTVAVVTQLRQVAQAIERGQDPAQAMAEHGSRHAAESVGGRMIDNDTAVHAIDLTEPLRKAATEEGFPLFQREPGGEMRGRITLADNRAIIDLFRSSDRSTFMHETGHLWLDEMARDAARENAPEGVRKDMETVLKWLGAERADAVTTEQHEKFARGFETYLASGEAPTSGLRAVFAQFKEWLASIYKGLTGAGEEVTPEIRKVMDRMIATPEQLGEGEHAPNVLPGPRAARGPGARDPETFSLLEFLASRGGIRANDPLVGDVRSSFGGGNKFVPGFGQLIRNPRELSTASRMGGGRAPMTLDQAREAAVEAGYLHDEGTHTGGESTTTIRTLLDAIDSEARGQRVYKTGREHEAAFDPDEELHRLDTAIDDAARGAGMEPVAIPDTLRTRIREIMTKEGERDPEIAYERALMEETYYGEEQGRAERIPDHIPGWDAVPDVQRPAQAAGGPVAQFERPSDAGASAPTRPGGGADRQAAGHPAATVGDGGPAAAARGAADWRGLAAATKSDDVDLIAPSRAAEKAKPPESTDAPEKAISAAERAAKDAEALLADILPRLTEEERILMTDMLNASDRDRSEREQIVREGAACLAAGLVGAV